MALAHHRRILRVALPAALNSLLDMLQVIVDLLMVGTLGAAAVAAVGLGLQSLMFVFAVLSLLHVGTSALLSRFVGAGQSLRASLGLSTLLLFAAALSLPVMAAWHWGAAQIFVWFGTSEETRQLGAAYVQTLTWMMPFVFLKLVAVSALNAAGDTKTPMYVKLISIGLNAALNYLLIFGKFGFPALGVTGAAVATVAVNGLETAIYAALLVRGKTFYRPVAGFSARLLKRALRVGWPASLERALTFGSLMLFTAVIAKYGTEALAGYQVGLRIEGLAFMPGIGFTVAAMAFMGQGLGAKDPARARRDVLTVLGYAVALMFTLSFVMIFAPEPLVRLFTHDDAVVEQGALYLRIVGLSQIPLAFTFVLSGALRGAGDTKATLRINLVSLWTMRLIPAFVFSWYFHDIVYVYFAMIADTFFKAAWLWRRFQSGAWQHVQV